MSNSDGTTLTAVAPEGDQPGQISFQQMPVVEEREDELRGSARQFAAVFKPVVVTMMIVVYLVTIMYGTSGGNTVGKAGGQRYGLFQVWSAREGDRCHLPPG